MDSTFFLILIGSISLIIFAHNHKNTSKLVKKAPQQPKSIKSFKEKISKHEKITNKTKKNKYEQVI
jgi:hypothetical protein